MNKPVDKNAERDPKPTDIQPGQTQFLRYRNGLVRGSWNGMGPVAITWGSGFAMSCPVNAWNDRLFVEQPQAAHLVPDEEIPSANAWFYKIQEAQRASLGLVWAGYRR